MARKQAEEEGNTGAGLLVMMVSLNLILLIFFIFLNSIGTNDAQRVKKALGSLAGRFGLLAGGAHLMPGEKILLPGSPLVSPETTSFSLAREFRTMVADSKLQDEVRLLMEGPDLVINLSNKLLFPSGAADLSAEAVPLLAKISGLLQDAPFPIRVEGHTDDQAIATDRYPSNWELSAARAAAVLRYFIEARHFPVSRLSAVGLGASRPLVPNNSVSNRARNRRVNIIVVKGKG